ncbi:MAG: histidine kinase [Bryobacterales bacterium]|nr:histidine kinase [Bryobacterales bacterium]
MKEPGGENCQTDPESGPEHKSLFKRQQTHGEKRDSDCKERLHNVVGVFHNEVGSPLAAIGLRLEMLRGRLRTDSAADAELQDMSRELDKVVDAVRRSLKELRKLEAEAAKPH